MKAQYVGDIGDFGKVLLLKHLAGLGFRIGVNWVLTKNDQRADGKHREYINYRGRDCLCCCDEEVFEQILPLARKEKADRKIEDLEGLIRSFSESVVFYSKIYVGGAGRETSENDAFAELTLGAVDLVFFDPDNGVGKAKGRSSKHIYLSDLKRYSARGQSILTYHHLSHEIKHSDQMVKIGSDFQGVFPDGHVYVYHLRRGTSRVYVLCVRAEHLPRIIGKESIPAIEPLKVTKEAWADRSRFCEKVHSAETTPTRQLLSRPKPAIYGSASLSNGYAVNASKNSTTRIGYVNKNGQVVIRKTGLRGTDRGQSVYQLGCSFCGCVYGANGSDIHLRKCPNCQRGAAGLPLEE